MSWVWVDEKPVWMGMGPEDEGIIMSVDEHLEFEMLEDRNTGRRKQKNVYGSTTIPYSRKKDEVAEHLRG